MAEIAAIVALTGFVALLLIAAGDDLRRYIIPNWTSVGLLIGAVLGLLAVDATTTQVVDHALVCLAAFALGYLLFHIGVWGGGDAKLFAATALWFDWIGLAHFTLYTAIAGGAVAALSLALCTQRARLTQWPPFAQIDFERRAAHTPYGVALAIGAVLAFADTEFSDQLRALAG